MFNESYEDYIRSILGYPQSNNNNNNDIYEPNDFNDSIAGDTELESCYPEIYKLVYPMVKKRCAMINGRVRSEDVENITDEIYNAIEQNNEINVNINLGKEINQNQVNTTNMQRTNNRRRETRQRSINRGLRDLIKILLIRELLGRRIPNRPQFPPRPPFPGPEPRPPMRPPIRPRVDELNDNIE